MTRLPKRGPDHNDSQHSEHHLLTVSLARLDRYKVTKPTYVVPGISAGELGDL